MDIRKIKKLIDLMIESDLQALEVKEGEQSISLMRRVDPTPLPPLPAIATSPKAEVDHYSATEPSPMVGVFYAAPSPGEQPYIRVGQTVKAGDVLGIIEAMKIMNPIEATYSGIIAEILIKNGEAVQFNQPLIHYK